MLLWPIPNLKPAISNRFIASMLEFSLPEVAHGVGWLLGIRGLGTIGTIGTVGTIMIMSDLIFCIDDR